MHEVLMKILNIIQNHHICDWPLTLLSILSKYWYLLFFRGVLGAEDVEDGDEDNLPLEEQENVQEMDISDTTLSTL